MQLNLLTALDEFIPDKKRSRILLKHFYAEKTMHPCKRRRVVSWRQISILISRNVNVSAYTAPAAGLHGESVKAILYTHG